jgi:hypothetical protein
MKEDRVHSKIIYVYFRAESDKLFEIPESIEVPQYSKVEWRLSLDKKFSEYLRYGEVFYSSVDKSIWKNKNEFYKFKGLTFTIYFNERSAFEWKKESLNMFSPLHLCSEAANHELEEIGIYREGTIKIADGIADTVGEYKYGVSVSKISNEESDDESIEDNLLYDEDPYIKVY